MVLVLVAVVVRADRRGAPSAPFSTGEQALLGQSHCEDCLFGYSSSSVFCIPPAAEEGESLDHVVKQVKATTTTTANSAATENNKNNAAFGLVPQKPAFVVEKKNNDP